MPLLQSYFQKISCTRCNWSVVVHRTQGDVITSIDLIPSYPVCPDCGTEDLHDGDRQSRPGELQSTRPDNPIDRLRAWKKKLLK